MQEPNLAIISYILLSLSFSTTAMMMMMMNELKCLITLLPLLRDLKIPNSLYSTSFLIFEWSTIFSIKSDYDDDDDNLDYENCNEDKL